MIYVKSRDGAVFAISKQMSDKSRTLREFIDVAGYGDWQIPVDVPSEYLFIIFKYLEQHVGHSKYEDLSGWDTELLSPLSPAQIVELFEYSNHLGIQEMSKMIAKKIARILTELGDHERIREEFRIKGDLSEWDVLAIRKKFSEFL